MKRLGCHAGHQEVSRCHTRGESEESIVHRWWSMQVRESTLALKPRVDVITSSKRGYQWRHKKDLCPPQTKKNFSFPIPFNRQATCCLSFTSLSISPLTATKFLLTFWKHFWKSTKKLCMAKEGLTTVTWQSFILPRDIRLTRCYWNARGANNPAVRPTLQQPLPMQVCEWQIENK